jgi:hypothetical protein
MRLDPPPQIHRDDVEWLCRLWEGYGELHWRLPLATWQAIGRTALEA